MEPIKKIENGMRTLDEIEKNLEDYPLIPMNEIEDEARLLAVRWVEGYEPAGFDLPNKHKLASDIMNYAKGQHEKKSNFEAFAIESIKGNERVQIGEEVSMGWIKASERLPNNSNLVFVKYGVNKQFRATAFYEENNWYHVDSGRLLVTDKIEWLDETPHQERNALQEEVERLRGALEKISNEGSGNESLEFMLHRCVVIANETLEPPNKP